MAVAQTTQKNRTAKAPIRTPSSSSKNTTMPSTARIRRKAQLPVRARLISRLKRKQTVDHDGPKLDRGTSVLVNIRQSYAKRGSLDSSDNSVRRRNRRHSIETPVTVAHIMSGQSSTTTTTATATASEQHASDTENESSRHKRVHFSNESTVKEIPHFSAYTESQRSALWNGRKAIRRMVRKNTQEYDYEGWNPETTIEEDDFIVVSGVRVHPAHVSRERIKQLEAAAVLQELNVFVK